MADCHIFSNQLRMLLGNYRNQAMAPKVDIMGSYYWHQAKKEEVDWACDECIQTNKAIAGEPIKQLFCDFSPHFAYFDQEKICRACKEVFVFDKHEQQHWYEQLRFWVQATRVYCKGCQSEKKQRDRISQLLTDFDYQDTERLKELVTIYLERKEYDKAKFHLTIGKKQRQKGSTAYVELDKWAAEIKAIEKREKPNA